MSNHEDAAVMNADSPDVRARSEMKAPCSGSGQRNKNSHSKDEEGPSTLQANMDILSIMDETTKSTSPVHTSTAKTKWSQQSEIGVRRKGPKKQQESRQRARPGKEHHQSSAFKGLGSLTSFMETRGISVNPPKAQRSSETKSSSPISASASGDPYTSSETVVGTNVGNHESESGSDASAPIISSPEQESDIGRQLPPLFLSTSLLKTHTPLILALERVPEPPLLIYRDYSRNQMTSTGIIPAAHAIPEADIIVSPTTGILLTTSQATTQRYLPGHKPDLPFPVNNVKEINSPLRERIFRLSPRYEHLYVFVCHAMEAQAPSAQKWLLSSMSALSGFCASLSRQKQGDRCVSSSSPSPAVIPILVSTKPAAIMSWIRELANKHAGGTTQANEAFALQAHQSKQSDCQLQQTETRWELFLRAAGMNPFSAQAVLSVVVNGAGEYDIAPLSMFIEMGSEARRECFEQLVGRTVFDRVDAVVDRDWQCDWALDFDPSVGI